MYRQFARVVLLTVTFIGAFLPKLAAADETLERDVCIVGGGSSGTYAAIQLKDQGYSVAVVERNDYLGGHSETLYLPDNNYIDYGVEGVFNDELSRDYFERLGVAYKPLLPDSFDTKYANFETGEKAENPSGLLSTIAAATSYRAAIEQFDYLRHGVYDLPDPVPDVLLRPFREFVESHKLQGTLQLVLQFAQNVGNLLDAPLLYIIQNFGIGHIDALLSGGYITPTNGMAEIFQTAGGVLGSENVLLQSTVANSTRSDDGVQLTVQSGSEKKRTLIKAKKLLITFPPLLDSLQSFDLDSNETSVFEKWFWRSYYAAIVNNTGIPSDINVANVNPHNEPGNMPNMPFQWELQYYGVPGYLITKIIGESNLTEDAARELVLSDIRRFGTAGTYDITDPEIVSFRSHSPETLMVSTDEIRGGFYRRLYGLQGYRSTFYTGLTFCTDYSSLLWAYTKNSVIEKMFN